MGTLAHRVAQLEQATGLDGSGCGECKGREVWKVQLGDDPEPEPVNCPACGRDILRVAHIIYVDAPEWRELWNGI